MVHVPESTWEEKQRKHGSLVTTFLPRFPQLQKEDSHGLSKHFLQTYFPGQTIQPKILAPTVIK